MSMIKKTLMAVTAIFFAVPVFAGGIEIHDAYARSSVSYTHLTLPTN